MAMKTTPRPWRIESGTTYAAEIVGTSPKGKRRVVARIASGPDREGNAQLTLRACNSHDALVEALKLCAGVLTGADMSKSCLVEALEKARAALALAGETP